MCVRLYDVVCVRLYNVTCLYVCMCVWCVFVCGMCVFVCVDASIYVSECVYEYDRVCRVYEGCSDTNYICVCVCAVLIGVREVKGQIIK